MLSWFLILICRRAETQMAGECRNESLFTFVNACVLGGLQQGYPERRGATMAGTSVPLKGSGTLLGTQYAPSMLYH
jgi:hypothetical protein